MVVRLSRDHSHRESELLARRQAERAPIRGQSPHKPRGSQHGHTTFTKSRGHECAGVSLSHSEILKGRVRSFR